MKYKRISYINEKWREYTKIVKERDGYRCQNCYRQAEEVVLQVHHKYYKTDLEPWEYPIDDCVTLCKGCHAREHKRIAPDNGWTLIAITDLGELAGECEREGCGKEIRYEHEIYHPNWGYMVVGSSCVDFLTNDEQRISRFCVKLFKDLEHFLENSNWKAGTTFRGKDYRFSTVSKQKHQIRIYGDKNYSFQIVISEQEEKKFIPVKPLRLNTNDLKLVEKISFITLKGNLSDNQFEKDILRMIYKQILSEQSNCE